jgi:serine/threonine-protein kinase
VVHLDLKPANILISEQQPKDGVAEPGAAAEADLANATDAESAASAVSAVSIAPAPAVRTDETADTGEADIEADVTDTDGPVEARLTDFGIARIVDGADQTTTAVTFGTPDYMAPETALDGAATPASDLYALGITLYELVVGRTPYAGGPALTVLARHLERTPRRLPTIPDPLWDVIAACTARNPADRPDAARTAAMLTAAEPALAGIPAAEPLPAGSDYRATSEVRLAGAVAAALAADAIAVDPTAAVQQRPADGEGPAKPLEQPPMPGPLPAEAAQGTAGPAAATSAPATSASAFAIPAAGGTAAPAAAASAPAFAIPAAEGTAAAAFAILAVASESRSATEPVAPTPLPHTAAASTIPKAAQ